MSRAAIQTVHQIVIVILLIIGLAFAKPDTAHASTWRTVDASMYGGPNDAPGCDSLACGVGKASFKRNIIATRTDLFGHRAKVGDLYLLTYRRHGKTYTQLVMRGDYGPAWWTHREVDMLWGCAKRLAFPGAGHVRVTKVGHLPRKYWRHFTNYRSLAECRRKLGWHR